MFMAFTIGQCAEAATLDVRVNNQPYVYVEKAEAITYYISGDIPGWQATYLRSETSSLCLPHTVGAVDNFTGNAPPTEGEFTVIVRAFGTTQCTSELAGGEYVVGFVGTPPTTSATVQEVATVVDTQVAPVVNTVLEAPSAPQLSPEVEEQIKAMLRLIQVLQELIRLLQAQQGA